VFVSSESGQTTTEYLMISGLITVIAVSLLTVMYPGLRERLQETAECIINFGCP
jgi:Flp pilus assembly pilin Flp